MARSSPKSFFSILGLVLLAGLSVRAIGAPSDDPTISVTDYPMPTFTSTVAPSLTSCDVHSGDPDGGDVSLPASGNAVYDSATSTALSVYKNLKGVKNQSDSDEGEDVKKGVGIADAASCGDVGEINDDKDVAKETACTPPITEASVNDIIDANAKAKSVIACQRGVLAAINGEFSCFAKQLDAANSYLGQVISSPGGLSAALQAGQKAIKALADETADRQGQFDQIKDRLDNPNTGMHSAQKALNELNTKVPTAEAGLENMINDIETATTQMKMAKTMECLTTQQAGWPSCVKKGTTSATYKSNPSPVEYLQCIYAQLANTNVGGSIVKNASAEAARRNEVAALFGLGAGATSTLSVPTVKSVPKFDYKKGTIDGEIGTYDISTPAQLLTQLDPLLSEVSNVTARDPRYSGLVAKFKKQVNQCYTKSSKIVTVDNANFQRTIQAGNATQMRDLAAKYNMAIKSATGSGNVQLNTGACEKATLENQAACLKGLGALSIAILNGTDPGTAMTGTASTLTNGRPGIRGFSATIDAKKDPSRTLRVDCSAGGGLNNCVAQYEGYQRAISQTLGELNRRKESLPHDINAQIDSIASCVASGGQGSCQGTGVPMNNAMSLNALSTNLAAAKANIVRAMSALGISNSLDLKNVKSGELAKDSSGMYTQAALKSLLLKQMNPPLLANDASGFKDAKDDIKEKDKELAKKEKGMHDYVIALRARQAECTAKTKKSRVADCDPIKDEMNAACGSGNQVSKSNDDWTKIAAVFLAGSNKTAKNKVASEQFGQMPNDAAKNADGTQINCGTAISNFDQCIKGITDNQDKGNQATGRNGSGRSDTASGKF
jgi:hypothetical protein